MNQINSIPEATDREPRSLYGVPSIYTVIVVIQAVIDGGRNSALRRTPPMTVFTNADECPIVVAINRGV